MGVSFSFSIGLPLRRTPRVLQRYWAFLIAYIFFSTTNVNAQNAITGAEQPERYLPLLQNKRVALVLNQTSRVGNTSLADALKKQNIHLVKLFVPEHGFRGTANAGAHIDNSFDKETNLPIISLYGDNKKPKPNQLEDVDVVVYDLQDVGVRFFTYISTLQYVMEACAENNKMLIVLDRPNPNGMYVDGPVLDMSLQSFVGMQRIPIVYGMTAGEYASMLKGEAWFKQAQKLNLKVIACKQWDHTKTYSLPVPPSPNLRTPNAVLLYPSLCLFEGTVISVGRGTDKPFEQWGHPAMPSIEGKAINSFKPVSMVGATAPLYEGKTCYGIDLSGKKDLPYAFQLKYLIQAFKWYSENEQDSSKFFNSFFEKLAGTAQLKKQIMSGMNEDAIRKSWQTGLNAFKAIRKKYLLYADFR